MRHGMPIPYEDWDPDHSVIPGTPGSHRLGSPGSQFQENWRHNGGFPQAIDGFSSASHSPAASRGYLGTPGSSPMSGPTIWQRSNGQAVGMPFQADRSGQGFDIGPTTAPEMSGRPAQWMGGQPYGLANGGPQLVWNEALQSFCPPEDLSFYLGAARALPNDVSYARVGSEGLSDIWNPSAGKTSCLRLMEGDCILPTVCTGTEPAALGRSCCCFVPGGTLCGMISTPVTYSAACRSGCWGLRSEASE